MSGVASGIPNSLTQVRDRLAGRGDALTGMALWLLIAALVVLSALDATQLFVVGVIVGSIYTLGSLGLTLVYGVLKFGNFAHGDTMMLGAYIAYFFLTGNVARNSREDMDVPWALD